MLQTVAQHSRHVYLIETMYMIFKVDLYTKGTTFYKPTSRYGD